MMKRSLLIFFALFLASPVSGQAIHDHPQLSAYTSPAEWPTDSGQCHWTQTGGPVPTPSPLSSHTHVDLTFPRDGEFSAAFVVQFTLKLHHTAGFIGMVFGPMVHNIIFDATGSTTLPMMRGDPMGDNAWTGHFTVDPLIPILGADGKPDPLQSAPPRGFFTAGLSARTYFDSGDMTETDLYEEAYSVIDPTAPERPARAGGHVMNVQCQATSARTSTASGSQFGTAVTEYQGVLPIAPIQTPWTVQGFLYNYSADLALPMGFFEQRSDLDFHNGIPGNMIASAPLDGNHNFSTMPVVFDPAALGSGSHKMAEIWTQPRGVEQLSALLVINVAVGPGVPVPTLCEDPIASNVGQPLPCVFAPPVVAPASLTLPLTALPLVGTYRLCNGSGVCVDLVVK